MTRGTLILTVVLAANLALNGYFFFGCSVGTGDARTDRVGYAARGTSRSDGNDGTAKVVSTPYTRNVPHTPAESTGFGRAGSGKSLLSIDRILPVGGATCPGLISELQRCETDRDDLYDGNMFNLITLFRWGEPTPEVEAKFQPFLDKHVTDIDYEFQCRGQICRLEYTTEDGVRSNWALELQGDREFWRSTKGVSFYRGHPAYDYASGQPLSIGVSYIKVATDAEYASSLAVSQVMQTAKEQQVTRHCAAQHPGSGTLRILLKLDAQASVIRVFIGGELKLVPVGVCITNKIREIAASTPIPANAVDTEIYYPANVSDKYHRGPNP